jgi:hypothetical protein
MAHEGAKNKICQKDMRNLSLIAYFKTSAVQATK